MTKEEKVEFVNNVSAIIAEIVAKELDRVLAQVISTFDTRFSLHETALMGLYQKLDYIRDKLDANTNLFGELL